MFEQSARYYDLVYKGKDYGGECERLLSQLPTTARTLLDVACGTGEHHRFLSSRLEVHGLDLNDDLLAIARAKNPSVFYSSADMRCFSTGRTYDAVTCLFSSIGYCVNLSSLAAALGCMAAHVTPGGILVVEPWLLPEVWQDGRISSDLIRTEEVEICRMSHSRSEGRVSVIDFQYLVGEPRIGVRSFQEQHRLGLFTQEEMADAFRQAGLEPQFDEVGLSGRGLYLGRS